MRIVILIHNSSHIELSNCILKIYNQYDRATTPAELIKNLIGIKCMMTMVC